MSTTQKRSSVGCLRLSISLFFGCLLFSGFLFATFVFVVTLVIAVQSVLLPQRGIQTQATVVAVGSTTCGKNHSEGIAYTVQFTDQAGHMQTGTLSCESISTLSRGDSITIVYSPDNPTLITLPSEVGFLPVAGVGVTILFGLIELALLLSCIFWVKHEKNIINPLLPGRKRADSRQRRKAEQVSPRAVSTLKTKSGYQSKICQYPRLLPSLRLTSLPRPRNWIFLSLRLRTSKEKGPSSNRNGLLKDRA